jgi:hypothetical protein
MIGCSDYCKHPRLGPMKDFWGGVCIYQLLVLFSLSSYIFFCNIKIFGALWLFSGRG